MAQNEVAKFRRRSDSCVFEVESDEFNTVTLIPLSKPRVASGAMAKLYEPLNPAAEALLNPTNEVVEIAKRLRLAFCGASIEGWGKLSEGERDCWRSVAREVIRMMAEELKTVIGGPDYLHDRRHDRCLCDAIKPRIVELEEMAKEPA